MGHTVGNCRKGDCMLISYYYLCSKCKQSSSDLSPLEYIRLILGYKWVCKKCKKGMTEEKNVTVLPVADGFIIKQNQF